MDEKNRADIQALVRQEVAAALATMRNVPAAGVPMRMSFAQGVARDETGLLAQRPEIHPGLAGEMGRRAADSFSWQDTGGGTVTIKNVMFEYDGVVQLFNDDTASVGTSPTYVYAKISLAMDGVNSTGIESVQILQTGSWEDASKKVMDETNTYQTGLAIPIYRMIAATGVYGTAVRLLADYVHAWKHVPKVDVWTTDHDSANVDDHSLIRKTNPIDPTKPDVLQLYDFHEPFAFSDYTTGDVWSDYATVLVRKKGVDGIAYLRYAKWFKLPGGSGTETALKWNNTSKEWEAVEPAGDEGYEEETLNLVLDGKIVTRTLRVKSDVGGETPVTNKADVATWDDTDAKLLLQVDDTGVLRVGKGYLKE